MDKTLKVTCPSTFFSRNKERTLIIFYKNIKIVVSSFNIDSPFKMLIYRKRRKHV